MPSRPLGCTPVLRFANAPDGALSRPAHPPLRLRGLDPAARYRDDDTGAEWSGATLTGYGLPVPPLPDGDCASALVGLRRVD
ncbi:GH36 C-terminal domain-containing protein [Streptomyces sp. NPDC014864]|uniref:GH36 C-terminal domain-containing protein n=1 Tax=Streptomyces sp. NPDC014864 TaxID=3364924 RepID=UPI0036F8FE6E